MEQPTRRPTFSQYFRGHLRFGWWWLPAVILGAWRSYVSGGWILLVFLLLVGIPLVTVLATWWEWRRSGDPTSA